MRITKAMGSRDRDTVHLVVCIKEVWDPEFPSTHFCINEEAGTVMPAPGLRTVISPFDEQAVEAALRLSERLESAKVTVLSVGQESAGNILHGALAMGADAGVLVHDPTPFAVDAFTTATILSAALVNIGEWDLILTGRQAADTDTGIVGCLVAEMLGLPVITLAKEVEVLESRAQVVRALTGGFETMEADLPVLVTVSHELGAPRRPSLGQTMRARDKPITHWNVPELLDGSQPQCVLMSRIVRSRLFKPQRREGLCQFVDGEESRDKAMALLGHLQEAGLL